MDGSIFFSDESHPESSSQVTVICSYNSKAKTLWGQIKQSKYVDVVKLRRKRERESVGKAQAVKKEKFLLVVRIFTGLRKKLFGDNCVV